MGEIKRLGTDFIKSINKVHQQHPDWIFVAPFASQQTQKAFDELKSEIAPQLPITYIEGQSRTVMAAADQRVEEHISP